MDTSYKRWKFPLHKQQEEGNQLKKFSHNEHPPFEEELFEQYFKYTYYTTR